ncbi:molybdopterin molybdotransferase MoeA [Desulfovibrio sp. QI0442]
MSLYFCLRETADITAFIAGANPLQAEPVSVSAALGRVLAADMHAPVPCPSTRRSTRDGYALRAADVAGACPATPVLLHMTGESRMGRSCGGTLQKGEAWRVYTGSTLPEGADAVLMQEFATLVDPSAGSKDAPPIVAASAPCAAGENILAPGADMPQGALLAQAGTKLGAHHMALLAQFFKEVPLRRKPVMGILSTGDEFCGSDLQNGFSACQSNTNALLLEGLAASLGANCLHIGTAPDNVQALGQHLRAALPDGPTPCDVIVVIGGSSGGKRDFSAQTIAGLPGCEMCGHDQRVSSGRPLTLARRGQTTIWGLPGHSLSLALAAQVFLVPLLQRLAGQQGSPQHMNWQPVVLARLGIALPVEGNAPTHYPVILRREHGRVTAWPVAAGTGKTAVLRDMDGWITMPGSNDMSRGGLRRGAAVRVRLFA